MANPSIDASISRVAARIDVLYAERKAALLALCHGYKLRAEYSVKDRQGTAQLARGEFWTNQTSDAIQGVKGFAGGEKTARWGLRHTASHGKWLEKMGRNPKNQNVSPALEPTVRELVPEFLDDVEKIFSG